MLVVDVDSLAAVDVLYFADEVVLNCFLAGDPQDFMRHQRPIDQGLSRPHEISGVNAQVRSVGDEVFTFDSRLATYDDRAFAPAFLAEDVDDAVQLRDNGRIFRLAGLENLGHSR